MVTMSSNSEPPKASPANAARCTVESEPLSLMAYRIGDVCKVTGLGRTSVYGAIKSGELVARRWGRCTIVLAEDLGTFLNNLPKAR
jgi:hypothetical protein